MQEAQPQQETKLGRSLPSELVTGVSKPAPLAQPARQVLPAAGEGMQNSVVSFFGMAETQFACTD